MNRRESPAQTVGHFARSLHNEGCLAGASCALRCRVRVNGGPARWFQRSGRRGTEKTNGKAQRARTRASRRTEQDRLPLFFRVRRLRYHGSRYATIVAPESIEGEPMDDHTGGVSRRLFWRLWARSLLGVSFFLNGCSARLGLSGSITSQFPELTCLPPEAGNEYDYVVVGSGAGGDPRTPVTSSSKKWCPVRR